MTRRRTMKNVGVQVLLSHNGKMKKNLNGDFV